MPESRDELRLPNGKLVVAIEAGPTPDITLTRIDQIMEERHAHIVIVWVDGKPAFKVRRATKPEDVLRDD